MGKSDFSALIGKAKEKQIKKPLDGASFLGGQLRYGRLTNC